MDTPTSRSREVASRGILRRSCLLKMLFYAVLLAVALSSYARSIPAFDDEMINYINKLNTSWKAGRNEYFKGKDEVFIKRLMGALKSPNPLPVKDIKVLDDIPDHFDAREKWSGCKDVIGNIRDQGACGSCWAFGAVEAMSDRFCIEFKTHVNISAEDLLACCESCGAGCDGGYPESAWDYFKDTGCVTGGQYKSNSGCQPYQIPHCDHHEPGPFHDCGTILPTPNCEKQCRSGYPTSFEKDKHFGVSAYAVSSDVAKIQTEIMTNGPVEGAFSVYADFITYKSGVYQQKSDKYLGGHAIKILGWGVDSDSSLPYWLVANSWNPSWGLDGYFWILRGKDECGIESGIVAGMPKQYSL